MASIDYSLLGVSEQIAADRKYRITVPLASFYGRRGGRFEGRIDLGGGATLAWLDDEESDRVSEANYLVQSNHFARHRLEIHDVRPTEAVEKLRDLLQEFLLVVREPLPVVGAVLDREVNGVWRRGGRITYPSNLTYYSGFPEDRVATLRKVRTGLIDAPKEVRRALDHYESSVESLWRGEADQALVLAALSFESLLGNGIRNEISYRLCLRAASLVGERPQEVFRRLKQLYDLRSRVVHGGKRATFQDATHFQQALMRLIPSVAALTQELGDYDGGLEALDTYVLDRSLPSPRTIAEAGWWSYVPLAECFRRSMPEFEASWQRQVTLVDY